MQLYGFFIYRDSILYDAASKKISEEEQNQAKVDFTSKRFIATYGLLALSLVFVLMEPIF